MSDLITLHAAAPKNTSLYVLIIASALMPTAARGDSRANARVRLMDQQLLPALERASGRSAIGPREARAHDAYAASFRCAGIDLECATVEEGAAWLAARSETAEIAAYVVSWACELNDFSARTELAEKLMRIADLGDPDPSRTAVRLVIWAHYDLSIAASTVAPIARTQGPLPGPLLIWLSRTVAAWELPDGGVSFVRRARAQSPESYAANMSLAEWIVQDDNRTDDDVLEALAAARLAAAVDPHAPDARRILGLALLESGRDAEGFAELRHCDELAGGTRTTAST